MYPVSFVVFSSMALAAAILKMVLVEGRRMPSCVFASFFRYITAADGRCEQCGTFAVSDTCRRRPYKYLLSGHSNNNNNNNYACCCCDIHKLLTKNGHDGSILSVGPRSVVALPFVSAWSQ